MTTNLHPNAEQRRSDLQRIAVDLVASGHELAESVGRTIDALRIELERAERERDKWRDAANDAADSWDRVNTKIAAAEARLVKANKLAEALSEIGENDDGIAGAIARDALAAWGPE